jgi:hypothetical protein
MIWKMRSENSMMLISKEIEFELLRFGTFGAENLNFTSHRNEEQNKEGQQNLAMIMIGEEGHTIVTMGEKGTITTEIGVMILEEMVGVEIGTLVLILDDLAPEDAEVITETTSQEDHTTEITDDRLQEGVCPLLLVLIGQFSISIAFSRTSAVVDFEKDHLNWKQWMDHLTQNTEENRIEQLYDHTMSRQLSATQS